jgi:PAS domain S-box-containing protein
MRLSGPPFGHAGTGTGEPGPDDELRALRAHFRLLVETVPEAILSVDRDGGIVLFNPGAEEVFGYPAEMVVGRPLDVLIPERSRESHARHFAAFRDGTQVKRMMGSRSRIVGLRADGSEFPAEASISRFSLGPDQVLTVVLRDVTEREATEKALQSAVLEAERASRAKSAFLANMSHELRTPLNAIIGFSEVISNAEFGPIVPARYREYIADILASGRHLLAVINNILDMSRIEAGRESLDEAELDLSETVTSCVRMVDALTMAGDVSVSVDSGFASVCLRADALKLRKIFLNLLSNAVKFTPAGGRVGLSVARDSDGGIAVRIADSGIGMTAEAMCKALEPFGQADDSLGRRFNGAGLGLPLAKALVELHGGSLALESEPGVGTTVTVVFPAARVRGTGPSRQQSVA